MFAEGTVHFKETVPLVSYMRNSLRFRCYASLSTCCRNVEKNWGHRKNLGEGGGQTFWDPTDKSVNFSALATSSLLFFGQ